MNACRWCGSPTTRLDCDKTCQNRYLYSIRPKCSAEGCTKVPSARGLCRVHDERSSEWSPCASCPTLIRARLGSSGLCMACWNERNRPPMSSEERARRDAEKAEKARRRRKRSGARLRLARAGAGTVGSVWYVGPCHSCGDSMVTLQPAQRFCSKRCAAREAKARRKSYLRNGDIGVQVSRVRRWKVFERDGWVCQLCGRSLDRDAVAPAPDSPSIDHVVPVAHGGRHAMSNLQAAHFLCNCLKSDHLEVALLAV